MTAKKHKHPHRQNQPEPTDNTSPEEKKFQELGYRAFFVFAILAVAHYYFQPITLGHDVRFVIFIIWLPILAGIIALAYYRRAFLRKQFADDKSFFGRLIMGGFYLIEALLYSFLSIAQLTGAGWDLANYNVAKHAIPTVIEVPVDRFYSSSSSRGSHYEVEFTLNNHYEYFKTTWSYFKDYEGKNPANYKVKITVQKGIWNFYMVNSWDVVEK